MTQHTYDHIKPWKMPPQNPVTAPTTIHREGVDSGYPGGWPCLVGRIVGAFVVRHAAHERLQQVLERLLAQLLVLTNHSPAVPSLAVTLGQNIFYYVHSIHAYVHVHSLGYLRVHHITDTVTLVVVQLLLLSKNYIYSSKRD